MAFAATTQPPSAQQQQLREYVDGKGRYSLRLPAAWEARDKVRGRQGH